MGSEGGGADGSDRDDKPITYRVVFPAWEGPRPCPVEGCSGPALVQTAMRVHFWYWYIRDTVVILEEGHLSHPHCPLCDMLVLWKALNGTHRGTS